MADRMKKLEVAQKHYDEGKDLSWNKGDFDTALIELKKSLQIRESIWGMFHDDTSKAYYEIGRALFAKKLYTDSLVAYRKCLRIRVSLYGKFHTETKNADHCVRLVVQAKGLYSGREINEAIDAIYSSMNLEISGDTYRKAGRNAEAQLEYIKAVAVEEYYFGRAGEILGEINRKAGIKAPPPPGAAN
jgi:tetratricopeptide (TPR) repeat protein